MYREGPRNLLVEVRSADPYPWLSWTTEYVVPVDEARNGPILSIAGLPLLSIPALRKAYIFNQKAATWHFLVHFLG